MNCIHDFIDKEEFKTYFSIEDLRMLGSPLITNFLKTWIIFKCYALDNYLMRTQILCGFRPWRNPDFEEFSFQYHVLPDWLVPAPAGGKFSVDAQEEEWKCFFDRWNKETLFNSNFEVFNTTAMGLGIMAKKDVTLDDMADRVDGFLEFVSEEFFAELTIHRYKSLYRYVDGNGIINCCILFGPLSLVNSNVTIPVGFYNTDDAGVELGWQVHFTSHLIEETEVDYENDNDEIYISHRLNRVSYNPLADGEEGFVAATQYDVNEYAVGAPLDKFSMFYRVSFRCTNYGLTMHYVVGEEVLINYAFMV